MNLAQEVTTAGDGPASVGLLVVIGLGVLLLLYIRFRKDK